MYNARRRNIQCIIFRYRNNKPEFVEYRISDDIAPLFRKNINKYRISEVKNPEYQNIGNLLPPLLMYSVGEKVNLYVLV